MSGVGTSSSNLVHAKRPFAWPLRPHYCPAMPSERLALALERMKAGDWLIFERFAAEFLAVEMPSLRTTAAAAGDKGRDGQLYLPGEEPQTAIQYSVTASWATKIRDTRKTLGANFAKVTRIIYCTNQVIGPEGDALVEEFRKEGFALDIRDRSWFVDRELTHAQRETASAELAERFVNPLLAARGLVERAASPLESGDAQVALLHLTLEGYDQASDKGLTKSCFESLVFSTLHDTSSEATRSTEEIRARVRALLPAGEDTQIAAQVDGALRRLAVRGGPVKQVGRTSAYHLSYEEQSRLRERTAHFLLQEDALKQQMVDVLHVLDPHMSDDDILAAATGLASGLQRVLWERGEAFARAVVSTGVVSHVDAQSVFEAIGRDGSGIPGLSQEAATAVLLNVLEEPSPKTFGHLRSLADGYTLFGFLRQTPDVQRVVVQMFSDGDIWLDTTVVLPLLAETLVENPAERHHTSLLQAARDAGLRLFVTDGIIEEVERHINRALMFARVGTDAWRGDPPFLYGAYAFSGRARASFATWLEEFRGTVVPEEDVKQYLAEDFGISSRNLTEEEMSADTELRGAVQEIWHEAHARRRTRSGRSDLTPAIALRLVAHDVENCVGVMQLRRQAAMSPLGHKAWWLTLDKIAFNLQRSLKDKLGRDAPPSPALSPDFLTELLRLGPLRSAVELEHHVSLPVVTDFGRFEAIPKALIDLADQVRRDNQGQSERVTARRVRDAVNEAKWRRGAEAQGGIRAVEARMRSRLEAQRQRAS
jgi:hypothetical protein